MADNKKIDLRLEPEQLPDALRIALDTAPGKKADAYLVHPDYGLILFWHPENLLVKDERVEAQPLPPISVEDFVVGWFKQARPDDFKSDDVCDQLYNDGDVSNEKGFRMFNEDWGHVADSPYAIVAIKPVWMWYGK